MTTVKIKIKDHLKEYVMSKFVCEGAENAVSFSDRLDVYHVIYDLTSKRPGDSVEFGNLSIALPDRREGKDPMYYNYLSIGAQKIIEKKIDVMFWSELHDFADENKHKHGTDYNESIYIFMRKYVIESISEDALLKHYYRWRKKVGGKTNKRRCNKG